MRGLTIFFAIALLWVTPAAGQDVLFRSSELAFSIVVAERENQPETPSEAGALHIPSFSTSLETSLPTPRLARPRIQIQREAPRPGFDWDAASRQSFYFLAIEHGFRLAGQSKTRAGLRGHFFKDYIRSIQGIRGWNDGDGIFTNYVLHSMQGAAAGYIQVQNDPRGMYQEFGDGREYWNSRLRALAWSTYYTLQFEVGLFSEATIGNVGKEPGTNGLTDFVVTPLGGFGMMVMEDALDRWVARLELNEPRGRKRRFYRILFNPNRSFANMLRGRVPWHRDTRTMEYLGDVQEELDRFIAASAQLEANATATVR